MSSTRSTSAAPLVEALPQGRAALETVGYLPRPRRGLRPRSAADLSWAFARLTIDALMLAAATVAATLGARAADLSVTPPPWAAAFAGIALLILCVRGSYAADRHGRLVYDVMAAGAAAGLAALAVLALRVAFEPHPLAFGETLRLAAYGAAYVIGGRAMLTWTGAEGRFKRLTGAPTLVVGAGLTGRFAAERLAGDPTVGLRPIGFLDDLSLEVSDGVPILGRREELERVVAETGARHVVLTAASAPYDELLSLLERCQAIGVRVSLLAGSESE